MIPFWRRQKSGSRAAKNVGAGDEEDPVRSKADVFIETGLTPEEYILAELEANDGRMTQQAICAFTGWSDGSISCLLTEMEAEGMIARVRIGHKKVVFHGEAVPPLLSSGDPDREHR